MREEIWVLEGILRILLNLVLGFNYNVFMERYLATESCASTALRLRVGLRESSVTGSITSTWREVYKQKVNQIIILRERGTCKRLWRRTDFKSKIRADSFLERSLRHRFDWTRLFVAEKILEVLVQIWVFTEGQCNVNNLIQSMKHRKPSSGVLHKERLHHVHEVVGWNHFLIEENQTAQKVVVHFLIAERFTHLQKQDFNLFY